MDPYLLYACSVNEIFDPDRVDEIYNQPAQVREASIHRDRGTNYSVVRLELLEKIYEHLYIQRLRSSNQSSNSSPVSATKAERKRNEILPNRHVIRVEDSPIVPNGLRILLKNNKNDLVKKEQNAQNGSSWANGYQEEEEEGEVLDVDVVLVASGYRRNAHEDILRPVQSSFATNDDNDSRDIANGNGRVRNSNVDRAPLVERDYRIRFRKEAVSEDAGIWLQGCNESTHGVCL